MQKEPSSRSSVDAQPTSQSHSLVWWAIKVACGALLISNAFLVALYGLEAMIETPRLLAQLMVISGGLCSIYHYLQLKAMNRDIQTPQRLETKAGLYRLVRHPMYLSDVAIYTGLTILYPTPFSLLLLIISIVALFKQADVEDRYLASRFSEQFSEWRSRSHKLIPYIY